MTLNLTTRTLAIYTALHLALVPAAALAAQQPVDAAAETAAFRALAQSLPLGTRIKVATRSGARVTATLMTVSHDAMIVKRDTRVPEPAQTIRYDELTRLQRDDGRGRAFIKALGVGLAAGAGAMLTVVGIAIALND